MHLRSYAWTMLQITHFCGVKFLAWKSGSVNFLTNIMSAFTLWSHFRHDHRWQVWPLHIGVFSPLFVPWAVESIACSSPLCWYFPACPLLPTVAQCSIPRWHFLPLARCCSGGRQVHQNTQLTFWKTMKKKFKYKNKATTEESKSNKTHNIKLSHQLSFPQPIKSKW